MSEDSTYGTARIGQHLVFRSGVSENAYLCDLAQGTTFFAEIDYHAATALLSLFYSLLDTEDQVRSASANIGTENIADVTLQREKVAVSATKSHSKKRHDII